MPQLWKTRLLPSKKIPAGQAAVWQIHLRAGERIETGGVLRLLPNSALRVEWTIGEFYFSTGAPDCALETRAVFKSLYRIPILECEVKKGVIRKGDRIIITLGNYSGAGPETIAPKIVTKDGLMILKVKTSPVQDFVEVARIPFEIVPAETRRLHLHILSPTDANSRLCLSSTDEFSNPTPGFRAEAKAPKTRKAPPIFLCAHSANGKLRSPKAPYYPGFLRDVGRNIYFGEMHLHCNGSTDGLHSPDFAYDYARHISGLAFCSITDHACHLLRKGVWDEARRAAARANKPGGFVTFLGYEYDGWHKKGHLGVHFRDDVPALILGDSYDDLWDKLKKSGHEFFTAPHHPNSEAEHYPLETVNAWKPYDWDYHDDAVQPLMEIFQDRGSFEKEEPGDGVVAGGYGASFQSALKRGCHLGVCGGSDTHLGRPGAPSFSCWRIKGGEVQAGLTAVLAGALTRDSIWQALKHRNTYATTGCRMLLDVRMDGLLMGERRLLTRPPGKIAMRLRGVGTNAITAVTLIRNGEVLREFRPNDLFFDIRFADRNPDFSIACSAGGKKSRHAYYYVRVTQEDGHRAWTSPIFFCEE